MAKPAKTSSQTKITRIRADEGKKSTKSSKSAKTVAKKPATATTTEGDSARNSRNPFSAIGRYLQGAWHELRQVRWPDRKSTWSMTGALLAFTGFFVVVILLLDAGFEYIFTLIMGN